MPENAKPEGPNEGSEIRTGRCLCGEIRYEVTGDLGPIVFCHCSQCRRAAGTAFATNTPIAASQFRITSGTSTLKEYESSPGKVRAFCGQCGSPLYSRRAARSDVLRIRVGTLDTPVGARPVAHIFATSLPDWDRILDDLPQYPDSPQELLLGRARGRQGP
jgi:hypothetical protein